MTIKLKQLMLGATAVAAGLAWIGPQASRALEPKAGPASDLATPFGRHGALTPREHAMAEVAWSYFVASYQEKTGMVNSVGSFASTTMWDTASYLSGLVSARELGIIDKQEFDRRAMQILATLRNLPLFRGQLPNKVYDTAKGQMVNYANAPGEIGFSALDIGRLLIWLKIMKERYPYLGGSIDNVVLRWNFCNIIGKDGALDGAMIGKDGQPRYVQEGRLGYEEYAAKGFQLWGFDTTRASSPDPYKFQKIEDIDVPVDGRDPRVFKTQNYVLTEGYMLEGLELNWDLASDHSGKPGLASDGWRADFSNRIYQVQERRFERTGILTARSEHQVEGAPYFVYDTIFADGYEWNTLDPTGVYQPDRAAVSTKAAIGMWALWDRPYTQLLFDAVADQSVAGKGFYEGIYENGSGAIPLETANNNGIILAALLYKVEGPILQYRNDLPQVWDNAFAGTDQRANHCLPPIAAQPVVPPAVVNGGPCPEGEASTGAPAYCRPAEDTAKLLAVAAPATLSDSGSASQ